MTPAAHPTGDVLLYLNGVTVSFDGFKALNDLSLVVERAWAQAIWSLALALGSLTAGLPELVRRLWPTIGDLDAYRPPFGLIILLAVVALVMAFLYSLFIAGSWSG